MIHLKLDIAFVLKGDVTVLNGREIFFSILHLMCGAINAYIWNIFIFLSVINSNLTNWFIHYPFYFHFCI